MVVLLRLWRCLSWPFLFASLGRAAHSRLRRCGALVFSGLGLVGGRRPLVLLRLGRSCCLRFVLFGLGRMGDRPLLAPLGNMSCRRGAFVHRRRRWMCLVDRLDRGLDWRSGIRARGDWGNRWLERLGWDRRRSWDRPALRGRQGRGRDDRDRGGRGRGGHKGWLCDGRRFDRGGLGDGRRGRNRGPPDRYASHAEGRGGGLFELN